MGWRWRLEKYVADHAPAAADPAPPAVAPATKRVRDLRAEVDEAHVLLESQADAAPLLVDTDRVRRSRKRAAASAQPKPPACTPWPRTRPHGPGRHRGYAWCSPPRR
nr:hypothetical protein GCM10017745_75250 [Saccharothrix mutabilis subsp. capreolus]